MKPAGLICTAVMIFGIIGCSGDDDGGGSEGNGGTDSVQVTTELDLQRNWLLIAATYEGHEYDFTSSPTAIPDANFVVTRSGEAQANAGCSTASVAVEVDGDEVSIEVLEIGSMRSCLPYTVDPMDGSFQEALEHVETGSISGDELLLSGPETELTFRRAGARGE